MANRKIRVYRFRNWKIQALGEREREREREREIERERERERVIIIIIIIIKVVIIYWVIITKISKLS